MTMFRPFAPQPAPPRRALLTRARRELTERARATGGFTLTELLIVMAMMLVVAGAAMDALVGATSAQSRDQVYGDEITATQTALARLTHDLRQATAITRVTPNVLQFQMLRAGTAYNVRYDCTVADTLGGSYRRCARTSAPVGQSLPTAGTSAGANDIEHVANATSATFCNALGSAQAGVFMLSNSSIANPDGSGASACDEAYETILAGQTLLTPPSYLQVLVQVPASAGQSQGLHHVTVLQSGTFLPNVDNGA